jgi:hypothetical protein
VQQILAKVNKIAGVRGSMIVNRDGIVAASDLGIEADETGIGAVTSSVLAAIEGALKRIKMGQFAQFTISGNEGKVAVVNAGIALLVVLLNRDVNMGLVNVSIKEAAAEVAAKSKL